MTRKMPDWVYNQMIDGLQKLLVLRLQGAPPADTITALVAVWEEALIARTWDYTIEADAHRLPLAFRRLIREADKWVQPAQLIKLIPPRDKNPPLIECKKPPPTPEQQAEIARNREQIRINLEKMLSKFSLTPPPAKTPDELLYEYSLIYDSATGKKRDQPLPDKRKKKS